MILALVVSLGIGAALSLPLFNMGRSIDGARLERVERVAGMALFPLLLLLAFWVISRLYAPDFLRILGIIAALPILVAILVVTRRGGEQLRRLPQIAAGVTLLAVGISESVLASAIAGGPPARFPSLMAQIGGPRAMPALGSVFRDGDTTARTQAAEELVKFGPAAAPYYTAALMDRDPSVRSIVVRAAQKSPLPEQKAAWCALLQDPNRENRTAARGALGYLKDPSTIPAILTAMAEETDVNERNGYSSLLQSLGRSKVTAIADLTKSDDAKVRVLAAESLGKIGTGPAAQLLLELVKDRDAHVRAAAYAAVGDAAAETRRDEVHRLIELEQGMSLFLSASGYVDPGRVLGVLVVGSRDPDPVVRENAVGQIGEILRAPEETINNIRLDPHDPDTGLAPVEDGPAVLALVRCLSDPDERVRAAAAGAFGETVNPVAVPGLIQALERAPLEQPRRSTSGIVTRASMRSSNPLYYLAQALGAAKDRRAIPALAAKDADYHPSGHCELCVALYRLGAPERVRHQIFIQREQ